MEDSRRVFAIFFIALVTPVALPLTFGGRPNVRFMRDRALFNQVAAPKGKPTSYLDLIKKLRLQGTVVKRTAERVSQPFFSVRGRILLVEGQPVQAFQFANAAAAEAEAKLIGPTGTGAGTWIAPPHFYHTGRLIVLYVGRDERILRLLITVLGPQFAGG